MKLKLIEKYIFVQVLMGLAFVIMHQAFASLL